MNRWTRVVVPSVAFLVLLATPAPGAPRERTETVPYDTPGAHVLDVAWVEVNGAPEAMPQRGEKTVSVALQDDSGRPVAAVLHQGDAELAEFCGEMAEPVRLVGRKAVHVHVYSGPGCSDVSIATQGTAAFTFGR
ncbi:MAG: hypothetical protein ABR613_06010 [Actinomycetota bacterium]